MRRTESSRGSVVVPAVNAAHAATIVRSLGRAGVHVIAVSERDDVPAFWSRYCDERLSVPDPSDDALGYRDALLALAKREDVRAIVPLREADQYVLSQNRSAFEPHVGVLWPDADRLRAVHDRLELFAAADRAGVPVPETMLLSEVKDWDRDRIVKGRWALLANAYDDRIPEESFGTPAKTMFLQPGEEPDVNAIVEQMGHIPIVQEYIDGAEYCLRALYHDGEPVATSQKRLVRGYKYSRGPSVFHEAVDIPELKSLGLALLDELQWEGMASVGFLRDSDGTFRLLEVNPRFPASIPMDVAAGVDYPLYFWELATTGRLSSTPTYRPGTATHLIRGELVHLHSVLAEDYPLVERPSALGTAASMARSFVAHPTFDHLDPTDPGPFLRDVVNVTTTTGRALAKRLDPRSSRATSPDADANASLDEGSAFEPDSTGDDPAEEREPVTRDLPRR